MRGWTVCWDKKSARHNAKYFNDKYEGGTEIWKLTSPGSTWHAFILKAPHVDITTCRNPHFDDLLDDPDNYRQITMEELS